MTKRWLIGIGALVFAFGGTVPLSYADPLHGFCWGTTPTCSDNSTVTPFDSSHGVNVGFTISPGPQTGDYFIDVLVPNTVSTASLSFSITGDATGTATLFSSTAWTSGFLDTYLGIHSSPANPIGAWLPSTQTLDHSATGYFVYQADLGTHTLDSPSCAPCAPELTINASHHFGGGNGTLIVGFLNTGLRDYVATANSGALFSTNGNQGVVPEPSTVLLLGSGLAGLGLWRKLKSQN